MVIEKLPSGSFRVRKTYKGKSYSLTFDRKPTKTMVNDELMKRTTQNITPTTQMKFLDAGNHYVESKRNVLSPSTIRDYAKMPTRVPEWFRLLRLYDITQADLNRLVNELSAKKSPKTVRNYHGFVSAVLHTYRPEFVFNTKLPQKQKKDAYIPTDEDVKKILTAAAGTKYEVAFALACYGLRRSEICGLDLSDFECDIVHITKAKVRNDKGEFVIKNCTKTSASVRDVPIKATIIAKAKLQGCVYDGQPGSINKWLSKTEAKLGIEHFSLHKMRHYFASKLFALGVPDPDILYLGGWETDHVLKSVYTHSLAKVDERRSVTTKYADVVGL